MAKEDYVLKNREWLRTKAAEPGVEAIDKGVLYKSLRRGNGASPNRNSVVTVHYTGRTINGKVFDSSRGGTAPAFRLRDLIPGWDNSAPAHARGRQVGDLHPLRTGLRRFSQPGIPADRP